MGKRSDFERKPRNYYPTPMIAMLPLIRHLPTWGFEYWEPCAGNGVMIEHLNEISTAKCVLATDIKPEADNILQCDALALNFDYSTAPKHQYIITNPPWSRNVLHPMIEQFSAMKPTWLLFDADWAHTRQSAPFMGWCRKIVSVGRVKWIPDSKMTGKDNAAWYLFDQSTLGPTIFAGRE